MKNLNILHFVYERKAEFGRDSIISAAYTIALVTEGKGIHENSPVYSDFSFLRERWLHDFEETNDFNVDLICESLLLYTLAHLCKHSDEEVKNGRENTILSVKQYVDFHFTDTGLDLRSVSDRFNYNPKYVSTAFVQLVKVSFSEYVRDLRMKRAETLLQSGLYNVHEVALACGYSDPLYFSKTFKKHFGMSPKKYIKEKHQ